ncbi:hypothetical protein SynA1825c_02270 [Synechococcus sp. A18-25c]|nr:hypothetical protein SynA1825c_02270 [Synechococcus sp. A18-25c]
MTHRHIGSQRNTNPKRHQAEINTHFHGSRLSHPTMLDLEARGRKALFQRAIMQSLSTTAKLRLTR